MMVTYIVDCKLREPNLAINSWSCGLERNTGRFVFHDVTGLELNFFNNKTSFENKFNYFDCSVWQVKGLRILFDHLQKKMTSEFKSKCKYHYIMWHSA